MIKKQSRQKARVRRHKKIRNKISGTSEKPRLSVFRSNKHIYAQIINDDEHNTIVAASTMENDVKGSLENTSNIDAAKAVGTAIGKKAIEKGITKVIFDRGGYIYHGKVAALADAARGAGLEF